MPARRINGSALREYVLPREAKIKPKKKFSMIVFFLWKKDLLFPKKVVRAFFKHLNPHYKLKIPMVQFGFDIHRSTKHAILLQLYCLKKSVDLVLTESLI